MINQDDSQAAADRQFVGGMCYSRIRVPVEADPTAELRKQRQKEAENDAQLRGAITLNLAHQMSYECIPNITEKQLVEQISEAQTQLSRYRKQWEKLADFPGDKTTYRLNLKYAQERLEKLLEQLAQLQKTE